MASKAFAFCYSYSYSSAILWKLDMAVRQLALSVAFAALAFPAAGQEGSYFNRSSEGWFWYKDPPPDPEPVEEPEPLPLPPPPPMPEETVELPPEPQPPPAPPLQPGSVAFLREAMPVALDVAMDDPTPENIERYFLLQKQAIDKSEVFAEVSKMVTTGHPELDEGRRRPRQDSFAKALEEAAEERKREVLTDFFKTHALVMFMDRNCSSCALMGENFFRMQQTHGLVWQSVSLDGTLLPPEISPNQSFDAGISEQLGVANGGAVFIAAPQGNTFIPVTWNPTGGAEIADRILLVARRSGLISDEQFRKTQAINPRVSEVGPTSTGELPEILRQADQHLRPFGLHLDATEATQ